MLQLTGVTLSAGGRELLVDLHWHLRPGESVGLVGRNGVGKTTLLRSIAEEHEADCGLIRRGGKVGYLPQHGVSCSKASLWDEVRSGMTGQLEMERALQSATEKLDSTQESIERFERAESSFRLAGGYAAEERIGEVLWGLGFQKTDWHRPCLEFSGGWRMRIALARLLLAEPELLLLDEPTNHLDLHARAWLARRLAAHKGALVLVSHDRFVLDRCIDGIVELQHAGLQHFPGSFGRYLEEREQRMDLLRSTAAKQQEREAKLERFVERFGAKANKAKQAKSKSKALEKLKAQRVTVIEDDAAPRLRFIAAKPRGAKLLSLRDASAGWDRPLFEGLELDLHRGERWVLLGANGTGKSTLLRALGGLHPLMTGTRTLDRGLRIGVFGQDQALELPAEARAVDLVLEDAPFCTQTRARSLLGALGLQGDQALQPVGTLSGGEKARVSLARLAARELDLLLLDEPNNHLDVVTVGVLTEALAQFVGGIVFVSHDRWFIEQLATGVVRFGPQGVDVHRGVRPEYLEAPPPIAAKGSSARADDGEWRTRQKRKRERERQERESERLELCIDELEGRLASIDGQLAERSGEPELVSRLLDERGSVAQDLEQAMEAWERVAT